jgi:O-antigen/teichoic acid export membrane protein
MMLRTAIGRLFGDRKFAETAAGTLAIRVMSVGLGLIMHLVLARVLGLLAYGLFAFAMAWTRTLTVPATLGLERMVTREVAVYGARDQWSHVAVLHRWSLIRVVLAGLVLMAVGIVVIVMFDTRGEGRLALALAFVTLPFVAAIRINQFLLQGMGHPRRGLVAEQLVQPALVLIGLGVVMAWPGGPIQLNAAVATGLILASTIAAAVVGQTMVSRRVRSDAVNPCVEGYRLDRARWSGRIAPLLMVGIVTAINAQASVLLLGLMGQTEAAGVMSVVRNLTNLSTMPTLVLGSMMAPIAAILWADRDMPGLQALSQQQTRRLMLTSLPIVAVLCLAGHPLLGLFGPGFSQGVAALWVLCASQVLNVASGSNASLLITSGRDSEMALITAASVVLNVVVGIVAIPYWPIMGAAWGAAVGLVGWNLMLAWRVRKVLGIRAGFLG